MIPLYLDIETYCDVPLSRGTYRYAQDAEIMILTYAIGDGPVQLVESDDPHWPVAMGILLDLVFQHDYKIHTHGSFDRILMGNARNGWGCDPFAPGPRGYHDVMAQAAMHSLPGALSKLCEMLGVPQDQAKDKRGRELIRLFCKPRPKKSKIRRATKRTHPEEWAEFCEYARQDIVAMRAVHQRLPTWNCTADEEALRLLDQKINDRGFCVDVPLATKAIDALKVAIDERNARVDTLTGGVVEKATQRDALLKYLLDDEGIDLPDMTAPTLERRITDPDLSWAVKELLQLRLEVSQTGTSKFTRLLGCINDDDRLRGMLLFCGALRTGRWAGRLFQPQNLPRPDMKPDEIEQAIELLRLDGLHLVFDNPIRVISNMLRGVIIAKPGHKLVDADLSNIEGRLAAWLAGEQWKLQAFRDYDAGTGPDLYRLAYARSFRVPVETVDNSARQIGKTLELSMGYEGGVGAFVTFATVYRIDLNDLVKAALPHVPQDVLSEARSFWGYAKAKSRLTYGLTEDQFVTCDSLKRLWRRAHPAIVQLWRDLDDAARQALAYPGETFKAGEHLGFVKSGNWLRMLLPSGRSLCYPGAAIKNDKVTYMGVCAYTKRFKRLQTYGGKWLENACQASSRDVMGANMPAIENAGYPIVLTVHDSVLTEPVDETRFNEGDLSRMLAASPAWATGLPLAAKGFEGQRFRKD